MALSQSDMSCALALLRADILSIRTFCGYNLVASTLIPTVYRLSDDHYLFSNITKLVVSCGTNKTVISPDLLQLIYQLPCNCSAVANDIIITNYKPFESCNKHTNITSKFIINIPLLHEFFDPDELSSFHGGLMLSQNIDLHLPELAVAESIYQRNVGIETQERFRMEHIINQTKQNDKTYAKLSHYVMDQVLKVSSDFEANNGF